MSHPDFPVKFHSQGEGDVPKNQFLLHKYKNTHWGTGKMKIDL